MSDSSANPLFVHPAFAPAAREISDANLGQILSVYASARTKRRNGDPLVDLGAPLFDFLLSIIDSPVISVTATNERILGQSPDAWFLATRFAAGEIDDEEYRRRLDALRTATRTPERRRP